MTPSSQSICLTPTTFTSNPKYSIVHISTGKYAKRKGLMQTDVANIRKIPTKAISFPSFTCCNTYIEKLSSNTLVKEKKKEPDSERESFDLSDISDFDLWDYICEE